MPLSVPKQPALIISLFQLQIRKKGKLPGECEFIDFQLEYGNAVFEVQKEAFEERRNVLIVDDLLATGVCKFLADTS